MTTSPVMTVTDELLAELEEAASNATQDAWELLPGTDLSGPEIIANGESIAWVLDSEADAVYIATANPATITALTAELRRLRAENAELGGLLRESGKTINQLQAEQPTPLRIARYLDAMRAKIDAAMRAAQ